MIPTDLSNKITRLQSENDESKQIISTEQAKINTNNKMIGKLKIIDTQKAALNKSQSEFSYLYEKAKSLKESPTSSEELQAVQAKNIGDEKMFNRMMTIAILLTVIIIVISGSAGLIISQM